MTAGWARGHGLSIVPTTAAAALADPALHRALADGVEYGYAGPLPDLPADATWFLVREGRADVGVAVLQRDVPRAGTAALLALAIAPDHRGRATATKAILVIERRLAREGVTRLIARVPRTNGRGLYFLLRVGYTPIDPADAPASSDDVTWFARGGRG